jgi:drug/metabolite transporter (DMT)-like permease
VLLNDGERVVPPGTASLLIATAPVFAGLLAAGFLRERQGRAQWAGSALAVGGVVLATRRHPGAGLSGGDRVPAEGSLAAGAPPAS